MKSTIFLSLLVFIAFHSFSQSLGLDEKNGFKDYKLGKSITEFPTATLSSFDCPIIKYSGFSTNMSNKLYYKYGFDYDKWVKDYIVIPNTTIFGFKVEAIMLCTYNGKIVRVIVRTLLSNNIIPIVRNELGTETYYNYEKGDNSQSYYWNDSNVEMSIHNYPFPNKDRFKCPDYFDIHFFSREMVTFLEAEVAKNNSSKGKDY